MRKNDARKWLHAALDLLPVLLIPVFMIYSHRHSVADGVPVATAEVSDIQTHVEYTYKYQTNDVETLDDLYTDRVYHLDNFVFDYSVAEDLEFTIYLLNYSSSNINNLFQDDDGVYDNQLGRYSSLDSSFFFYYASSGGDVYINFGFRSFVSNPKTFYITGYSLTSSPDLYFSSCDFIIDSSGYSGDSLSSLKSYFRYMGVLPTSSTYLVPISATAVVDGYTATATIDYQDSTITNVFLDNFCNTVDTYFNFGNVFNLGNVYSWVETNIFNGSAPQIVPAIWNIAVYEFIMDLIFLLYALFMFFIDFCVNLVDRFHTKCSGGK